MAPLAKEPIAIGRDLQFVILPARTSLFLIYHANLRSEKAVCIASKSARIERPRGSREGLLLADCVEKLANE